MQPPSIHPNCYKKNWLSFFLSYKKEQMPCLSTKERKGKLHIAAKEFNDKLLNLVTIQYGIKKAWCN